MAFRLSGIHAALAIGGLATVGMVHAQQTLSLTAADLGVTDAQLTAMIQGAGAPAGAPGVAFGSPVGFGANWGTVGVGIGGATLPKTASDDYDGSMGFVAGFGDSTEAVGLEVTLNVISLRDNFGEDGNLNLKLHRNLGSSTSVAVGVENVVPWGDAKDADESVYVVGTKVMDIGSNDRRLPLAINLGLGNGRFDDPGEDDVTPFAGIALMPHPQWSLIADWAGTGLNLGVSAAPVLTLPLTISVGMVNVTERNNSGSEFAGGIGYSWQF
jgi:hypothetical protein